PVYGFQYSCPLAFFYIFAVYQYYEIMKKQLLILFVSVATLVGCGKDGEKEPESPYKSSIVGTWELTHFNGASVESMPEVFNQTTTITFGSNGSYSGKGVFGNGSGTYELSGSTARTYIDGELYHTYEIISLSGDVVVAKMTDSSSSATIKAKKI